MWEELEAHRQWGELGQVVCVIGVLTSVSDQKYVVAFCRESLEERAFGVDFRLQELRRLQKCEFGPSKARNVELIANCRNSSDCELRQPGKLLLRVVLI